MQLKISSVTYPMFIFNVDTSSIVNKVCYCLHITLLSSNVQGNLREKMKQTVQGPRQVGAWGCSSTPKFLAYLSNVRHELVLLFQIEKE